MCQKNFLDKKYEAMAWDGSFYCGKTDVNKLNLGNFNCVTDGKDKPRLKKYLSHFY